MKALLKIFGSLLIGACIGMLVAVPIIALIDGQSLADIIDKEFLVELLPIGWVLIALFIAFILHIILHEGGHLVAGLLTGYRFVSFRFLNFTLIRKDGRLKWRNFELSGTLGQCLMAPPDKPLEQIDTRWYNAGGVLANVILVLLALLLMWALDLPTWLDIFLKMMVFIGIAVALMNGIPMKMGRGQRRAQPVAAGEGPARQTKLLQHL